MTDRLAPEWDVLATMATQTAVLLLGKEPSRPEAKAMGYGIGSLIEVIKKNPDVVLQALGGEAAGRTEDIGDGQFFAVWWFPPVEFGGMGGTT